MGEIKMFKEFKEDVQRLEKEKGEYYFDLGERLGGIVFSDPKVQEKIK